MEDYEPIRLYQTDADEYESIIDELTQDVESLLEKQSDVMEFKEALGINPHVELPDSLILDIKNAIDGILYGIYRAG